jgi:protein-L-isoaspartate(D-aspartate) O-methyltransferase
MENENQAMYEKERNNMVELHLKPRGIADPMVLSVMGMVPRHLFVRPIDAGQAYADHPLLIDEGQTISQPYIVALMTEALNLLGTEKVLEIGTGSGYQAAVLSEMCEEVYTIEIREGLADSATDRLRDLGYLNTNVKWADGYYGWEDHAPFDAIIITCAVNHVPPYLLQQLKDGGKLILPLGSIHYYQTLTLIEKKGDEYVTIHIASVRFVPMIGQALKPDEN